jgi:hypothetical protein
MNWLWLKENRLLVAVAIVVLVLVVFVWKRKKGSAGGGTLSAEQEKFLEILHPKAHEKFRKLIIDIEKKTGWKVIITSSYRTFQHQIRLYAENSKNGKPGKSFHNYGLAMDVNLEKDGRRVRKADSIKTWLDTGAPQIAESQGFKWGGRFKTYHDPVHFDLSDYFNLNINELYAQAENQFGSVENAQGNKIKF